MTNILAAIKNSLFTRLLFIFLVSGMMIAVILGHSFGKIFKGHMQQVFINHAAQYGDYLKTDIGLPPDTARARELAAKLNIALAIQGPGLDWQASSPGVKLSRHHFKEVPQSNIWMAHNHRETIILMKNGPFRLYFSHGRMIHREISLGQKLKVWSAMFLVIFLTYLAVRRLFRPIKWVREGARKIGEGNLDHRLPEKRCDELGRLSGDINAMAAKIRQMLEAKRQLLLAISHELRTPLTRLKLALEFVEPGRAKENIRDDIGEMEQLIEVLLEGEKLATSHASLNLETFGMNDLAERLSKNFGKQEGRTAKFSPLENELQVTMDKTRITLLLKNLLGNAFQHSGRSDVTVELNLTLKDKELTLCVSDNGRGMTPEQCQKVMEPFYRTEKSRTRKTEGQGLGLYLCKLIAEAHGGQLIIRSEPEKGTSVSALLPLP